jgi:hypothetical protein
MITSTQRTMHGRRVFAFYSLPHSDFRLLLIPPFPPGPPPARRASLQLGEAGGRIFSRGIVLPYRTTTGPTSEFQTPSHRLLFPTFSSRQEPPEAAGKCLFSLLSACFRGGATRSLPYLSCSPAPHRTGQAAFPHTAPRFVIQ